MFNLRTSLLFAAIALTHVSAQAFHSIGFCTHLGQSKTDPTELIDWLSNSNFNTVRDEVYWRDVEPSPNQFKLTPRAAATLQTFRKLKAMGVDPLIIVGYGNTLYDGGSQPYTDEGREAFARYSGWLATNTAEFATKFEIWNEWNIGAGRKPFVRQGSASDYVKLVEKSAQAIRKANPKAEIIGGSIAEDLKSDWLKEAIDNGLLKHVDAVSIHLYNHSIPMHRGGAREMVERIRRVHDVLTQASPGKRVPIYVTETGWPTNIGQFGVPHADAATQSIEFLFEVQALDYVDGIWFYDFKNDGNNPANREDNFGLIDQNSTTKPAGCAIRDLTKKLKGAQLLFSGYQGKIRVMLYRTTSGEQLLGAWAPWIRPDKDDQSLDISGKNLNPSPVDLECFDGANQGKISKTADGLKIDQGYSPTVLLFPASSKIDLSRLGKAK